MKGDWGISEKAKNVAATLPSLNSIKTAKELNTLDGKLVRFSGFVQDMIEQDFFLGLIKDPNDPKTSMPCKYFQPEDEDVKGFSEETFLASQLDFTMNRGNVICTTIPNENKWLQDKRGVENDRFDQIAELCIIKCYDDSFDALKMNKAYELIGSLEYKPLSQEERAEVAAAIQEHGYLPQNVIPDMDKYPVIHLMSYMEHPYKNATEFFINAPELESNEILRLREQLLAILTEILGGDELAAEYILLSLLSKVQSRKDGMPLGISCINLYINDEDSALEILKGIEKFMKLLMCHTLVESIDLESLSKLNLVPRKDYDTNRLIGGNLQFLNSTAILFDETQLKEGKMEDRKTIENIQAIASLIEEQKVRYDFQFHSQDFLCSAAILIVSQTRSIFKNTCPLPVYTKKAPNSDAVNDIDSETLDQFRLFFNQVSRKGQMNIGEEVNEHIQNKFVEARKANTESETKVDATTLHKWLDLSRLEVISNGSIECNVDTIDHIITLETDRQTRVTEVLENDS